MNRRRLPRGRLPLGGALLAALASPGGAQTTDAFAGVPGVTVRPYPVRGEDAAALRRAIDAARPVDPHGDEPVDALTHWRMTWTWPGSRPGGRAGGRPGGCDLGKARVAFAATVTLPRLADGAALPPPLANAWTRYLVALERHEAAHVRYAFQHRNTVLAAIRGARCGFADRAARSALAAIVAHDIAYDRDTHHGLTEGASFPPICDLPADGVQQSTCTPIPEPIRSPS